MTDTTHEIRLDLLVAGNGKEWEIFVRQISPLIYSVISKILRLSGTNTDEARDILQDFFVRVCSNDFRILKQFDPKRSQLSTWLALIARNVTIDYLRRRGSRCVSFHELVEPGAEEPSEEDMVVEISFEDLPPRQMLIMKLLYEQGIDVKDVSAFLGISQQTVRSMRHKAIERLRKKHKNY